MNPKFNLYLLVAMRKILFIILFLFSQSAQSQIIDDFIDGDFLFNPTWIGSNNNADFIISNNRLRSNSSQASNSFYISTTNTIALNAKWEFWVNLQFNTSGTNYVDVYLIADKSDLKDNQINGYFVRIGNTNDEICLYKRSGLSNTNLKLIDGVNGTTNLSNSNLRIRVTRSNEGVFTLERDLGGTNNSYFSEGSASDLDFTKSDYFGLLIQQSTSSFFQKHFFDDFNIQTLVSDKSPPELIGISSLDSNTLEIVFNEAIDSLEVHNKVNYSLENYDGQIEFIQASSDPTKFKIKLTKHLNTGTYKLKIVAVKDKNGNVIQDKNTASFAYKKPYKPQIGDILINEIFADPSPQIDLPSVEFLELFNKTNEDISLHNWSLVDPTSSGILLNTSIPALSYLILCAKSDTAEFKKFGQVLGISPWPSLSNSGEKIKLKDEFKTVIDSVSYLDSWHNESTKKQGGWTLERISPTSACQDFLNWESAKDQAGGTPGKQNSIFIPYYEKMPFRADSLHRLTDSTITIFFNKPLNNSYLIKNNFSLNPSSANLKEITSSKNLKQITLKYDEKFKSGTNYQLKLENIKDCNGNLISNVDPLTFSMPKAPLPPPPPPIRTDTNQVFITEIFADPSPEVALPLIEFIEIFNPGIDTLDLLGWSINDPQTKGLLKRYLLPPNQYLILTPISDTLQFKKFGKTLGVSPWPSLKNNSDEIVLKSFTNRTVDSLSYSESWYKDVRKIAGGWSLEKIDLENKTCGGFYNWAASVDSTGGTPGRKNSLSKTDFLNSELKIDSIKIYSEYGIDVFFNQIPDSSYLKAANFKIKNGTEKARKLQISSSRQEIRLLFEEKFKEGEKYTLSADSLYSCSGKLIEGGNATGKFEIASIAEIEYPIIINEILADPTPQIALPEAEFIELFNPTDQTVELKGMSLGKNPPFKTFKMEAGSYLILCPEKDTLSFKSFGKVIGLPIWTSINNQKDSIQLKNNKGRIFQQVNYLSSWHRDSEKSKGGYSLELIDYQSTCPELQKWASSLDTSGGTPGRKNSVHQLNLSKDLLKLIEIEILDSVSLAIRFNREIDSLRASYTNNYKLNNGVGNAILALPQVPNFDIVILKFKEALTRGQTYRLIVNNIGDCGNNIIAAEFNSGEFHLTPKIQKNDVLLSEILFNPKSEGSDFVEIYNNAPYSIDLKELTIAQFTKDSLSSIREISKKQLLLEPGEYLALSVDPENIKKEYSVKNEESIHKMGSMPVFNDDEGIAILLSNGKTIDQLSYTEKMHFPLLKNVEGVSLERSKLNKATSEGGNLRSATMASGGATPGYQNSQNTDEQILQDEWAIISKTFSPDNDGFEDLFEISYRKSIPGELANISIFNDQGALVKKLIRNYTLNTEGTIIWDGINDQNQMSPMGIYLLHVEIFNLDGQIKRFRKSFALASKFK